ncbi:MAG: putative LPS assembly protein LptD, partial [Bacteroidota bacterium]
MKAKLLLFGCLLCGLSSLSAQDTTAVLLDTLQTTIDTTRQDSSLQVSFGVPISKDSIEATVTYNAVDSMIIDATGQKIHLYGDAFVQYTTITLRADHIELDWSKNEVVAEGLPNDTTGVIEGLPEFTEGENTFNADRMRYNFDTRKGVVYDVVTEEGDIIVRGTRSKFVSAPPGDTTANDVIYSFGAIFTTCTADHPHFGIRSSKQKVIPDKLVVVGPSNLEIMGVPTPVWLPFGFFPISQGRRTGLMFPQDYEYSEQWGFGFRNVGWFFPLGESFNLTLLGDIYLQGTYGLSGRLNYKKRYRYTGNLNLRFDSRREERVVPKLDANGDPVMGINNEPAFESIFERQNGFLFNWTHNQDPAAHPMNRLGGSINFQTNNAQQRIFNDARSVLQTQTNSNFSFSRNWNDKPISMSVAFRHSQSLSNRTITVDFPTFQFQTQALYPFRKKERVGQKKWYEDITLRYTNEARANFVAPDTSFFERSTLEQARYGMQHNITTGTSFKIFKYFNLNPGASYREVWSMERLDGAFDGSQVTLDTTILDNGDLEIKTVDFGTYNLDTIAGFSSFREYSANLSLTTQIFGTVLFNKGPIRGLRHVIKPTITVGYAPDYQASANNFLMLPDTLDPTTNRLISRFQNSIFSGPPNSQQRLGLNYSFTNILEMKRFVKRDSTVKNVKLFDNIYVMGNYNFAADSLKWSPIMITGTTRLFKGASTFSFATSFDPQQRIDDPLRPGSITRIDETTWSASKRIARFVDANFRLNTTLTVGKIRAMFQGEEEEVVEQVDEFGDDLKPSDETDFLSLFENFSIRHNLAFGFRPVNVNKDTFTINTNSLQLTGSFQLTPNWNVDIGSIGYDFARQQTTYPFLGLRRDLHCW